MDNVLLGEIRLFAGNFAPYGWALCNGQIMPISQNTALFSLLGNMYGGDGKSTFQLPDLQGSIAVHQGAGPGLTARDLGETFGDQTTTLDSTNLPPHTHAVNASNVGGTTNVPTGNIVCARGKGDTDYTSTAPNATMKPQTIHPTGNNLPVSNMQPTLTLNYIIALRGVFPQRA